MGLILSEERKKGHYGFLPDSIAALLHFHVHSFFLMGRGNIHIIPDDTQGGIIALALENSVSHLLRLFLHPILSQRLRGFANEMKDIAVSAYEGTIRLDMLRLRF